MADPMPSRCCCSGPSLGFLTLYALQRLQWYLPFNPQEQTGVEPEQRLQYLGQLFDQYELAVQCAGNHYGLSRADGQFDGAQFRLGGDRDRAGAGPEFAVLRVGRRRRSAISRLIYGVGGIIVPFIGIKLIDLAITAIGLA